MSGDVAYSKTMTMMQFGELLKRCEDLESMLLSLYAIAEEVEMDKVSISQQLEREDERMKRGGLDVSSKKEWYDKATFALRCHKLYSQRFQRMIGVVNKRIKWAEHRRFQSAFIGAAKAMLPEAEYEKIMAVAKSIVPDEDLDG